MRRFSRILLACALLGSALTGWAATVTTTFTVTATVVATCSVSATALSFGTAVPNPINTNVDATSTITATCSAGAPYTVSLNAGTGAGATFASRRMTSGPNTLAYTLFTDAGRSILWGDGTGGGSTFNGAGTGTPQPLTVFGRIPSGQSVPPGAYSDTITVTITF